LSPCDVVHLEPSGDGWKVSIGPFRDAELAKHVAERLRAISAEGLEAAASVPEHVLQKVAEGVEHCERGPGSFILRVDGEPGHIDVELSKTSRSRDPRPKKKRT
jgi:hypothetical protein